MMVDNLIRRGMRREETGSLYIFWEENRGVAKMWLRKWEGEKINQLERPNWLGWFTEGNGTKKWVEIEQKWLSCGWWNEMKSWNIIME
jgi:hypothetical protein